jgi:uncharacterized protein (TIRG00374 family)
MSKSFWYRLLPLSGLVILSVVIYWIGIRNIINAFRGLRYELLSLLPLLLTALLIAQTSKWQFILRHQQIVVPFAVLFRVNLIGIFYGSITPGKVGGLLKIRYLADYCKKPATEVGSSVVIDKLIELIVLGVFATVGSAFVVKSFGAAMFVFAMLVTMALVALLFTFYFRAQAKDIISFVFSVLVPREQQEALKKHIDQFYGNIPGMVSLLFPLLLTGWCWILVWTLMFIVGKALSMNISYGIFIVIVSIGHLIALIPITLDGIGTREAALVVMLSAQGIDPAKTMAMSLLSLLLCVYTLAFWGALETRFFAKARPEETGL